VVAISGSVVTLPLVGCVPVQPPEAAQDCTPWALHCRVVAVPAATLLFTATIDTAGVTEAVSVELASVDDVES
jgi:hypothetical protein